MLGDMTLQRLLAQNQPDGLAEATLLLARELRPQLDIFDYLQRLHAFAIAVSDRVSTSDRLGDVLFHLNDYLFNDCGFSASSEGHDIEQNFLHHTIDSRRGTPLTLAIIYLTVGRWLGLPLQGMLFPGRTLVAFCDDSCEVVMDPADGGLSLQEADLEMLLSRAYPLNRLSRHHPRNFLSASDDKTLLVCMLRQLKQVYQVNGDLENALWALQNILNLVPELASGFRERGHLYEQLDCSYAAAMDYTHYLELLPDASDAQLLRKRLPDLLCTQVTLH